MLKRTTAALLIACILLGVEAAPADITWDPAASAYNGTQFAAVPGFTGAGVTTTGATAYGAGFNTNGVYVFGFLNSIPTGPGLPTFAQTEIGSTVLIAGTSLVLELTKAASDKINFVAILADASQTVSYELLSSTRIRIRCNIVDPVASASGDASSAFGLVVSFANIPQLDFKSTVFTTNLHFLDISAPTDFNPGTAGVKGNGINGTPVDFNAYLPLQFLATFGVTEANVSQVNGYVDGVPVVPGTFQNLGLDSSLGFNFEDPSNPNNTVLKVKVTNSSWSPHTIGFGRLDRTGPTITLTGKASRKVTSAATTVKGSVTDTTGVTRVEYSLKNATTGFKNATLKASAWSVKLKNLKKKKTQKLYVRGVDTLANVSAATLVKILRTK